MWKNLLIYYLKQNRDYLKKWVNNILKLLEIEALIIIISNLKILLSLISPQSKKIWFIN